MKLVTYTAGSGPEVGVVDDEAGQVRDVTTLLPDGAGLIEVIEGWTAIGPALAERAGALPAIALDAVELLAPIPTPRRDVFCVGKNYREHVAEFGRSGYDQPDRSEELPEHPVVFTKATTAVTGPYADVDPHHGVTGELDYEAELAVIIGKGGRGITREEAFDHVWGYTIVNDVTARDLQRLHKQWTIGKSLDTHCPMGPWAVTADEIVDVTAAAGRQLRQRRAATVRRGQGPDLRHPRADRRHLGRDHAAARRRHRHGHPGRRRHRRPRGAAARVRPARRHAAAARHPPGAGRRAALAGGPRRERADGAGADHRGAVPGRRPQT